MIGLQRMKNTNNSIKIIKLIMNFTIMGILQEMYIILNQLHFKISIFLFLKRINGLLQDVAKDFNNYSRYQVIDLSQIKLYALMKDLMDNQLCGSVEHHWIQNIRFKLRMYRARVGVELEIRTQFQVAACQNTKFLKGSEK